MIEAYKLMRRRKDGTLGSLFIDTKAVVPMNKLIKAKSVRTKGFKFRPGWHSVAKPSAPHLSKKGRVWVRIWIDDIELHRRPRSQGGLWFTSKWMAIQEVIG